MRSVQRYLICPNRTLRSDFMTKKLPKLLIAFGTPILINGPIFQKVKVLSSWKLFKCDSSLWFSLETILFHNILFLCGCLVVKWVCDARASTRAWTLSGPLPPRCNGLQAWLVYQNEVPMGATNWCSN